jgi:4-amino-4-deoxy-L-arabinose transferase-like glycosyltransferase
VFVILGAIYSVTVPLWEAPDEPAHFDYVLHLARTRTLPTQRMGVLDASHHPPLYYLVAALMSSTADLDDPTGSIHGNPRFIWSGKGGAAHNAALHHSAETFPYQGIALAAHLARLVSVAAGTVTVICTYTIARLVFVRSKGLALFAAAVTAFNPQFLFIASSINPDAMTAMTCSVALWQLVKALKWPSRWQMWASTGLWCGLALLSKSSAFTIGLVAGLGLLVIALHRRSWELFWRSAFALGAASALVSGWWFVRNWVQYGDPLGWQAFLANWRVVRRVGRLGWPDVREFFTVQFQSYWARFGWMTIPAPQWTYRAIQAVCVLGLVGWGIWVYRRRWRELNKGAVFALPLLVLLPLLQEGFQLRSIFAFNASWYQGRYLFPAIAALSVLLAGGLWHLAPDQLRSPCLGLLGAGLLTFAIVVPVGIIRPVYAMPSLPKWRVWTLPHRCDVIFGDRVSLLGYRVCQSTSENGRELTLTFYWRAEQDLELDYSAFVHLVGGANEVLAQGDAGLGSHRDYASSAWWVGDIVPSQHTLRLPPRLPLGSEIRVGLYFWADPVRLPAMEDGSPSGDHISLSLADVGLSAVTDEADR